MDRYFKFVGWCSLMNDFIVIVKLSFFLVKKKKGGGGGISFLFKSGVRKGVY